MQGPAQSLSLLSPPLLFPPTADMYAMRQLSTALCDMQQLSETALTRLALLRAAAAAAAVAAAAAAVTCSMQGEGQQQQRRPSLA